MKTQTQRLLAALFLILIAAPAFAAVEQNLTVPFNLVISNSCLGEPVALSGPLHVLISSQQTGNGLMLTTHFQPQDVVGTGLNTGSKYRGTGVTRTTLFTDAAPPFDFTSINNFRIIGAGQANNFMVHMTVHMTVNANGEITANVVNADTTCKP